MGRVKEFAFWLAECVYQKQMSDRAIVESINLVNPYDRHDGFNRWLRAQIHIVRTNPHIYQPHDDCSTTGERYLHQSTAKKGN